MVRPVGPHTVDRRAARRAARTAARQAVRTAVRRAARPVRTVRQAAHTVDPLVALQEVHTAVPAEATVE